MPLPNYPEKHGAPAVIEPATHNEQHGRELSLPDALVVTYQPSFFEWVVAEHASRELPVDGLATYHELAGTDGRVGVVGGFGFGAPVTASIVELCIAGGAGAFAIVGGCGGLGAPDGREPTVLVDRAIRDEGVSHHYLPDGRYVAASEALTGRFADALDDDGVGHEVGPAWTTSAFFRETVPEVELYGAEGVLAAEMEAAALFAVCEYRGVSATALLSIQDYVGTDEWVPPAEDASERLRALYAPARDALLAHVAD